MSFNLDDLEDTDIPKFIERHEASLRFPEKLMLLLLFVERTSAKAGRPVESACITWTRNGKAVVIRNEGELVRHIIPRIFRQKTTFGSFLRTLKRWGFHQLKAEPHYDPPRMTEDIAVKRRLLVFANEHFQRDNKQLLANMHCTLLKKTSKAFARSSLAAVHPSTAKAKAASKRSSVAHAQPNVAASLDSNRQVPNLHLHNNSDHNHNQNDPPQVAAFLLPSADLAFIVTRSQAVVWSTSHHDLPVRHHQEVDLSADLATTPKKVNPFVAATTLPQKRPSSSLAAETSLSSSSSSSSMKSPSSRRRRLNPSSPCYLSSMTILQEFLLRPVVLPNVKEWLLFDILKAIQIVSGIVTHSDFQTNLQHSTSSPSYNFTLG